MENVDIWRETLLAVMTTLWSKVAGFVPNLVGAILLLIIGYFLGKTLCFLLTKGLKRAGFNKLSEQVGISRTLTRANILLSASEIVGKLAFWIIMLTFVVTATEALGLPRVSETIDEFVLYLPKVIGAVLVLIIGLFLAHFVRDMIRSGAEAIGIDYAKPLSSTVYGILFVIIVSLSVSQLEIDTRLLDNVISILIAAMGVAAALSLGMGTRDLSANIVAGVYVRDLYQSGDSIQVGSIEGILESVGTVKTQITQKDGTLISLANSSLVKTQVSVKR